MWSLGSYASPSVRQFAEDGDMTGFDKEAQSYGGIRDSFTAAPIRGGLGKSGTHFITDGRHTKVTAVFDLFSTLCTYPCFFFFQNCSKYSPIKRTLMNYHDSKNC